MEVSFLVEEWLQGVVHSEIASSAQTTPGWHSPVRLSMSGGYVWLAEVALPDLSEVRAWVAATAQHLAVQCGRCCKGLLLLPVCALSAMCRWLGALVRHLPVVVVA